jgi:hypothetical protein
MPTWPVPPGRRSITIELLPEQIAHLDAQAEYLGCSRAAYFRRLIVEDRSAHPATAPHPDAATLGPTAKVWCLELPDGFLAHLDQHADRLGCSRSAFARHLILSDIRRQGPVRA